MYNTIDILEIRHYMISFLWSVKLPGNPLYHLVPIWIRLKLRLRLWIHVLFSFFFFFSHVSGVMRLLFMHCSLNSSHKGWLFHGEQCIRALFTDPQIPLFSNFFIKNGSHCTIHTFKNYFATVFSVSIFSFSKNKLNPNEPLITCFSKI